jgi:hypothetical protein
MRIASFTRSALLCAAALGVLGACSTETPPYEELPLRDALSAAPDVIAALPEQALRDVAARLEEAHRAGGEEAAISEAGIPTVPALVRTADAAREEEEKDVIVLAAIEPRSPGFVLRGVGVGKVGEGTLALPALEGDPATSTAALEEAALRGRAGAILGELGARVEARELIRTTGLPAGVVAMDGTMYVNASWLVALSALDATGEQAAPPAPPVGFAPPKAPQSVRANPYKLPGSINQCALDVEDVCTCAEALQCDHEQTDPTFANAQLECEWVKGADGRAAALCVLALMSIEAIRDCVRASGSECTQTVIATREDALLFMQDEACVDVLNACLQFGRPAAPVASPSRGGCTSSGCSDCDCDDCNNSNGSSCNDDCDKCNQNCQECNQNCKDCNQNCKDCNQSCKDCNDGKCLGSGGSSAAFEGGVSACKLSRSRRVRAGAEPDGPVPFMPAFWLLAPVGYIARRIRRRA